jgi:hypothetical protein
LIQSFEFSSFFQGIPLSNVSSLCVTLVVWKLSEALEIC